MAIILTVFVVDRLIKNQENRKLFPLKRAAFREVQHFINEVVSFWRNVYLWTVPDAKTPSDPKDLFSMTYFYDIAKHLNLNKQPRVLPARTWWTYLPQMEKRFSNLGEKILERHASVLDADAYELVHRVTHNFLNQEVGFNLLEASRQADQQVGIRTAPFLGNHWMPSYEDLREVGELYDWVRENLPRYR